MIDFRYHLVSIIAVFLALTVGLVLGTTMLQDPLLNTLQSETSDLRGQTEDLRTERDVADKVNAGADEMAEAVSKDMLDGLLTDLGVVVVAAPGADQKMTDALVKRVEEADGEVVGRIQITGAFLEGDKATFVDELSLQIAHEPGDLTGSPYEKAGAEIGRALAVTEEDEDTGTEGGTEPGTAEDSGGDTGSDGASDAASDGEEDGGSGDGKSGYDPEAVLDAFSEGGLITVEDDPAGAADAVLFVAPAAGASHGGDDPEAANAVLGTLTAALHEEVDAVAVAGDGPSARGDGMLAQARAQESAFATVDVAGRPMGEIITILALAENLEQGGGAYGIGERVRGFLPDPLPDRIESSDEEPSDERSSDGGGAAGSGGDGGAAEVRRTNQDGK
ncbi:copper transporter [Nocardiopsis quinghaiensis]|uniref:copper transporter n=1 Tax=Nocardiopsis quinghaiensis TaxID=464995 RepID=UPI00123AD8FD|nr:copper transporter [Nocardiopsis quinghaiensis]